MTINISTHVNTGWNCGRPKAQVPTGYQYQGLRLPLRPLDVIIGQCALQIVLLGQSEENIPHGYKPCEQSNDVCAKQSHYRLP